MIYSDKYNAFIFEKDEKIYPLGVNKMILRGFFVENVYETEKFKEKSLKLYSLCNKKVF